MGAGRYSFVPEYAAGKQRPDRGLFFLHHTYLRRGGVRPEKDVGVFFNEKGILHVACRMFEREIQGSEVVPVVLDLGAFAH